MKTKKLISLFLAVAMIVSLVACTSSENENSESTDATVSESNGNADSEVVSKETSEEGPEIAQLTEGDKIVNYNFDDNSLGSWYFYAQGGTFEVVAENSEMVVKIKDPGHLVYSTQVYVDGFSLNQNCIYNIDFDIRSDIERDFEWRIQLNGGDYHAYVINEHEHITTEMSHVNATFTMEENSDPAPRLCFNLGPQGDLTQNTSHNVYIDNITLTIMDASEALTLEAVPKPNPLSLNQVGYKPDDAKTFVSVNKHDTAFDIIDTATQQSVYTGTIEAGFINSRCATQSVHQGDFSDFTTPGTYYIHTENEGDSYEFTIADDVFDDVYASTVRMLYLQRCGMELTKDLADDFAHPLCHSEEALIYGTDSTIDVSGGWHDAGDYGRYVVPGAKTVEDLFLTYEDGSAIDDDLGIPESGNGIPDLLDEAKYELDWMLKMQAENGGVYHKVTCADFPGTVMPQNEVEQLIVSPISTAATGDFAAVMAKASVLYREYDATFADTCLAAAEQAYDYLSKNAAADTVGFRNPDDILTGEYPDAKVSDEYFWACVELFLATKDSSYISQAQSLYDGGIAIGLGWADVGMYGVYDYLNAAPEYKTDAVFSTAMLKCLKAEAKKNYDASQKNDGYFTSMGKSFPWGSNMTIANIGMIYHMAARITGNEIYQQMGSYQADYLLGMNPVSYCFVTGYGTCTPEHVHHRPSQAMGTAMPGMLVGGPNSNPSDSYAKTVLQGLAPAKCYVDNENSYSTNEITIYWNSPLIYLLALRK